MVFVNLKRQQPVPQHKKAGLQVSEKRCMNCGAVIDNPFGGIDARRFCCSECKEEYLSQK